MEYREQYGNLFTASTKCLLAHCIGADFALGAGIANEFRSRFNVRRELLATGKQSHWEGHGYCILTGSFDEKAGGKARWIVGNLVTKQRSYGKPTYESLREALEEFRNCAVSMEYREIAMPKIGCGLDGLEWSKVSKMIQDVFKDTNLTITVYILP